VDLVSIAVCSHDSYGGRVKASIATAVETQAERLQNAVAETADRAAAIEEVASTTDDVAQRAADAAEAGETGAERTEQAVEAVERVARAVDELDRLVTPSTTG
jgi:methyl-accepting chemotaxis protein